VSVKRCLFIGTSQRLERAEEHNAGLPASSTKAMLATIVCARSWSRLSRLSLMSSGMRVGVVALTLLSLPAASARHHWSDVTT
jgi:hypothetical protein